MMQYELSSVFCGLVLAICSVHPEHSSLTEIEFNHESKNFEVAICVCMDDLERALHAESMSVAAKEKFIDRFAPRYIQENFRIYSPEFDSSGTASIQWVGHERDAGSCWLYFEYSGVNYSKDLVLENEIFIGIHPNQINQIRFQIDNQVFWRLATKIEPVTRLNKN